ncbi:PadR family transcriptional regulator [Nostoc sp. FACHB-133]|uniref:PadR family transcriptional regulator n=1 Tax=Nostoc sp. FACHB-133 TaxID=2692835 RepID=UPI00168596B5|nr:PadR family transcriptional regulator [Nostoc sp. FACHB-133]MBD2527698.1 PadR family transcriptional regulator [Nostoc sp. FACHB-133]
MNGLKYLLLAGLTLEPRSGYDLTQWIAKAAQHYWAADHSSIYPALAALERQGLVIFEVKPSERGPKRKVYFITENGRKILLDWVDISPNRSEIRDEFLIKVLCYDFLPPERAISHLQLTRKVYVEKLFWFEQSICLLNQYDRDGTYPYAGRFGIWLTIRRGILSAKAIIAWCDEAIALIQTKVEATRFD